LPIAGASRLAVAHRTSENDDVKKMQLMALLAAIACLPPVAVATEGNAFERVFPNEYRDILRRASLAYDAHRYDEAFGLYQRGACAGDKQSQSVLGRMYLLGQGVERNDLTGYAWLKVAAEVIFPGYQKIVKSLEGAMTPEQRKQADAGAARKIDLYGLAATNMSCGTHASRGGHIVDEILCTPRIEGQQLLLRRCAEEPAR